MRTKVKICCISSVQEARDAISFGADALGLVAEMPSGPGVISDAEITAISSIVPPPVSTFLLTSRTNAEGIIAHHQQTLTSTIQLVDSVPLEIYPVLREKLKGIKLVQVIHVTDEKSLEEAEAVAAFADAVLLDSGNPNLKVKELGGTGRKHDWQISRKIVEKLSKPVFLAGGLHPGNIREAIETVQPFGVDLCSSVRTNGKLDLIKLGSFFKEINTIH